MFSLRLTAAGLLLSLPFASLAQRADPAPYPRFYGGLAVYSSEYNRFAHAGNGVTVPLQATMGYQLRPRLAVQAGLAYSSLSGFNSGAHFDPTTGQNYNPYAYTTTYRNTSWSLLGRYTLTRKPAHRVQFDLLAGFTMERSAYHSTGFSTDSVRHTSVTTAYDERGATTTFLLTAGPSVRYRFGQHLELVYDFLFNCDLSTTRQYPYSGITGSAALGLRYRFGQR